jgi:hypothetical protein
LILLLVAAAACVLALYAIVPLAWGAALVGVLVWFALPGLLLARRLYGPQPGSVAAALLAGPAWGYVLSSLGLLALWATGARHFAILMLAPLLGALLIWPVRRLGSTLTLPAFDRRDAAACALVLLAVPAIVGLPFARVGEELPEGRAYRAYFTADFVWGVAVVAEVSKGDMPPKNPYFLNDDLHYYWLMHLLPSAEHRALGGNPTADQLLLVNAFWSALAFSAFFYFFVRHFVSGPIAAALACVFVLFCSSFEGAERIWWHWSRGEPILPFLRMLNIDAVTGWIARYSGMKVDGLHRLLLYQPQHQTAYLLGISAVLLLHQAKDLARAALFAVVGGFIAASMLFSSFASMMIAGMAGLYAAWRLVAARQWRAIVSGAAAAIVPMVAAIGLIAALRYVDTAGGELVEVGLNSLATSNGRMVIFLSFGPVLIWAAVGAVMGIRRDSARRLTVLWFMFGLCALFYFFVNLPDSPNSVGWHAGKIGFVILTPLVGIAFHELWARGGLIRPLAVGAIAIVAVLALPTVAIDLYNTQDVWNRGNGPGYRWTVLITPEEHEGLEWIKRGTFKSAIVQVEPVRRGHDSWTFIPAFAERRMAAGFPLSMIPLDKYEAAIAQIKKIYQSTSAKAAYDLAMSHCIDYLVIGLEERAEYPQFEPLLESHRQLFIQAFRNHSISVYYLPRAREQSACR